MPQDDSLTKIKLVFVRHGRTPYHEYEHDPAYNLTLGDERPFDLTPDGVNDVLQTALILERTLKNDDQVVLWSSEAWRAIDSRGVIKEVLLASGIKILKEHTIRSLRPFDVFNQEFVKREIINIPENADFTRRNRYFRDPAFQEPNNNFEVSSHVRMRALKICNWLRFLAETGDLKGNPLNLISTTHFEVMYPLMEDIFGFTLEKGQEPRKGEGMSIEFEFDKILKEMTITAECRGIRKEGIVFDKETRKFKVPRELEPAPLWSARIESSASKDEFKQFIIHNVRETGINCFGYLVGSNGNWSYVRNMYPRRDYGEIQSNEELNKTSEEISNSIEGTVNVEERISTLKFRVLLGLEVGYKSGKFHTIDEVKEILGESFELTQAEIFTVRSGNTGPSTYQEPAVLIEGDIKEIQKVIQLATRFGQERFCLENLEDGTSRIIETVVCSTPDKE